MILLRLLCALLVLTAGVPALGAADGNEAPLVDAGLDQSVAEGSVVYLDGGGAVDPDGEIVEYWWSIETPRGRTVQPSDPAAETTRFVPNSTGRYRVTLTASDDDGDSRSDTIFVDVHAVSPPADGRTSPDVPADDVDDFPPAAPPQFDIGSPGPDDGDSGLIGGGPSATNQAPYGQIYGPDSVRAGGTGRYSLQATDEDGHVVDYWWVAPDALSRQGRELKQQSAGRSYTFDVEPGTTVEFPVVLVDNSGAQSTVSKTVQVTNNPPQATLVGNTTVVVGSVHEYEAVASDPDGPITSYSWSSSEEVSKVETGGLLGGSVGDTDSTLLRFDEIPQDDATATVGVTVRDEHGGERTVGKNVIVTETTKDRSERNETIHKPTLERLYGETEPGSKPVFKSRNLVNYHRFTFTAEATDKDSDRLIYHWAFGEKGTARTVETGNDTESTVDFMFQGEEQIGEEVPITVTVEDETGRTATKTKVMNLEASQASKTDGRDIQIETNKNGYITGYVTVPASRPGYDINQLEIHFGDGTSTGVPIEEGAPEQAQIGFEHRYEFGGTYTVYVFDGGSRGTTYGSTDVSVEKRTYTEWTFERKSTSYSKTIAKEKPGAEWKRSGVDHEEWTLVETRHQSTPILEGTTLRPGPSWERVGTEVEYHTEHRTTRAIESPGSDWKISERAIDYERVFDGWESITVANKGIADSDWEYVGEVPRTVHKTETEESVNPPSGSGWTRNGRTGEYEQTGTSYQWVSSMFYAEEDWDYVRSSRYVKYWNTDTRCAEYGNLGGYRYCIREETTRTPVYDYKYLYKVPQYDPIYEWERTVEQTVYDYEYQYPTYVQEPVHEYTKEAQVAERRATWRKDVYESTIVYEWTKNSVEWEKASSLARPTGNDIRNVTKTTKDCGDAWEPGEPSICASEDQ